MAAPTWTSRGDTGPATIRLVPYPVRAPHGHFAVHVLGRLVTQMYIGASPSTHGTGPSSPPQCDCALVSRASA